MKWMYIILTILTSIIPLLSMTRHIVGEFVHLNKNHFPLYCGAVMGEEEGVTDTCSYSLIVRMLLLLSGVEPHPGPPTTYTVIIKSAPYKKDDSLQLTIMCSNGQLQGKLAAMMHHSTFITNLLVESDSCRHKYNIVYMMQNTLFLGININLLDFIQLKLIFG